MMQHRGLLLLAALTLAGVACAGSDSLSGRSAPVGAWRSAATPAAPTRPAGLLPGMPAPLDPRDLYAADRPGRVSPRVRADRPLVYVPNFGSNTVSVIDPRAHRVLRTCRSVPGLSTWCRPGTCELCG
jgi:DNA-binding beta-propeller fold protein YncE